MDQRRTLCPIDVVCRPHASARAGGRGSVVELAQGRGVRIRGEVSGRACLTAGNKDMEERHELSKLFGRLWSCLWIRRSPSFASSRQRVGRRGGTVVGPDGSLMVGRDLPCCLVCVGVLVGVADTGVNQQEKDECEK